MKSRGASIAALIILIILSFLGCQEKGDIKIGAILPLTGDAGVYGEQLKKGMDLAVERINNDGGVNGRKLVIVYEDGMGDPKTSVSAYQKISNTITVPLVIGPMFSAPTLAVAPLAQTDKNILLSPTASAVELTDAGNFFYRIYPSDIYDGEYLARFCYEDLGAKKVGIIYLQASSTSAISDVFSKVFTDLGGEILSKEAYQEGDVDFRTQLNKVSAENPDVIFIPGYLQEMALLLRQAKEMGVNVQFVSISTFYDPKILELAGNSAEGILFSAPSFNPENDDETMQDFVKAYRSEFDTDPDILGGYGYDVVYVAVQGLKSDSKVDKIREALNKLDNFPAVTGNVTFDDNGDVLKDLNILTVKDGQFQPFE